MAHVTNEDKIREQDKEIVELKFTAMDAKINSFKEEVFKRLDLILEQTSKTNGSVARAVEAIHKLEMENIERDRAIDDLVEHKKGTSFWYVIQTNKWIAVIALLAGLALTSSEIRMLIIEGLKP